MKVRTRRLFRLGAAMLGLAAALVLLVTWSSAASGKGAKHAPPGKGAQHASAKGAQHVRWDIISTLGTPPGPLNPGGHASATAPDGDTITLTGSGTFVAPASGKGSGAARGGGSWTTSSGGSGTYRVTALVSWVFANFQATTPVFTDNIDQGRRSNGTAVLKIAFSDGSTGVLTVGCHG